MNTEALDFCAVEHPESRENCDRVAHGSNLETSTVEFVIKFPGLDILAATIVADELDNTIIDIRRNEPEEPLDAVLDELGIK